MKEQFFSEFRFFLTLKKKFGGQVKNYHGLNRDLAGWLEVHPKTIQRYFTTLKKRNWIGYDSDSKIYFIRGFDRICFQESLEGRTGARINHEDLGKLKEFVLAVNIGYFAVRQRAKVWKYLSEQIKGRSVPRNLLPTFYPVSNESISKIFGCSLSTASRWKKEAWDSGFLKVLKIRENVNLTQKQIIQGKKHGVEGFNWIKKDDQGYYIYLPDKIQPPKLYSRRGKKKK